LCQTSDIHQAKTTAHIDHFQVDRIVEAIDIDDAPAMAEGSLLQKGARGERAQVTELIAIAEVDGIQERATCKATDIC
jgi:hypothetical protein